MAYNPLVSTAKSSDSSLHAALHPLVLLTISDYITRHTLRQLKQPIVGVLLGQQNGREVTIEHAYDVRLLPPHTAEKSMDEDVRNDTDQWQLHEKFFQVRLQQYKDVHKEPPLELVGWWTLSPPSGPQPEVMSIHEYIMENYNESSLLLTFQPQEVQQMVASAGLEKGAKLPLTIYESVYESNKPETDTNAMQVEGGEGTGSETLQLRLREMPYEIVTGEAEMISVDFVQRGGGNASAIEEKLSAVQGNKDAGKPKEVANGDAGEEKKPAAQESHLNPEEEELLAFLKTRANAIQMLQSRIALLKKRLTSLQPSYLTATGKPIIPVVDPSDPSAPPHQLLRAILALTTKLALVTAHDPPRLATEATATRADGALVDLLATLGTTTRRARELGGRFAARDTGRRFGMERGGVSSGGFGMGLEAGVEGGPAGMMGDGEVLGWGSQGGTGFGPELDHSGGSRMEF